MRSEWEKRNRMMKLEIDYFELQTSQFEKSRAFFANAAGWRYVDYGPDYAEIRDAGLVGGFERCSANARAAPLIVLKTDDLEKALDQVTQAGAEITKPIFSFPGGRRFHFKEPGGNELAVWIEDGASFEPR